MKLTKSEAQAKYPGVFFYGDNYYIGAGAFIRAGATIASVCSRYVGNIIPMADDEVLIRIGCEIHTPEDWDKHGAAYARQADATGWGEATGTRMLEFLKGEAKSYLLEGK